MKYMSKLLTYAYHAPLCDFLRERAGKMGKKLLTVGWDNTMPSRNWISFFMEDLGFEEVVIVEAYRHNAVAAQEHYSLMPNITVIHASLQDALKHRLLDDEFDSCMWSHGPEHVSIEDLKWMVPELYSRLGNLFIAWCPWGDYYVEDDDHPNKWQQHQIAVPTPEIFNELDVDLTVKTCDIENGQHGLVWMYKEL